MTFNQLNYFQAVCRLQSITQAAEYLHISQPSLSRAIHELENEFHLVLFERKHDGMVLTTEGEQFRIYADGLLLHTHLMQRAMSDLSQQKKSLLLGVPPMLSALFLPSICREWLNAYPDGNLSVVEDGQALLQRQLKEGLIDLALLPHDRPLSGEFSAYPLIPMETVCCVAYHHPFAQRKSLEIADLAEQRLVLFTDHSFQTESILLHRFGLANIKPQILLQTDQLATLHRVAATGVAVGLLFQDLVFSYPDVTGIPLSPPILTEVSLVWRTGSLIIEEFRSFIIESIEKWRQNKNQASPSQLPDSV